MSCKECDDFSADYVYTRLGEGDLWVAKSVIIFQLTMCIHARVGEIYGWWGVGRGKLGGLFGGLAGFVVKLFHKY